MSAENTDLLQRAFKNDLYTTYYNYAAQYALHQIGINLLNNTLLDPCIYNTIQYTTREKRAGQINRIKEKHPDLLVEEGNLAADSITVLILDNHKLKDLVFPYGVDTGHYFKDPYACLITTQSDLQIDEQIDRLLIFPLSNKGKNAIKLFLENSLNSNNFGIPSSGNDRLYWLLAKHQLTIISSFILSAQIPLFENTETLSEGRGKNRLPIPATGEKYREWFDSIGCAFRELEI